MYTKTIKLIMLQRSICLSLATMLCDMHITECMPYSIIMGGCVRMCELRAGNPKKKNKTWLADARSRLLAAGWADCGARSL